MDVTGLIGLRARLVGDGGGPDGPWRFVVVGGFDRLDSSRVGQVAQGLTRPNLILMDVSGYLIDHSIDDVQVEAKP